MGFSEEELQAAARELQQQMKEEQESSEYFYDDEEEEQQPDFKKYVLRINSEHTELIEQLSYEDRNTFFNELLDDYIKSDIEQERAQNFSAKIKNFIFGFIAIVIGLPIAIWLFSVSLDATHSNYKDMQDKFIKLYDDKGKRY